VTKPVTVSTYHSDKNKTVSKTRKTEDKTGIHTGLQPV
jgi:hypothetical protein